MNPVLVHIQLLSPSGTLVLFLGRAPDAAGPHEAAQSICVSLPKTPPRTSVSPPVLFVPSSIMWPAGRGRHVDRWICGVPSCIVWSDIDSPLAKIPLRRWDLGQATQKVVRCVRETSIRNEKTEGVVKTTGAIRGGGGSQIGSGEVRHDVAGTGAEGREKYWDRRLKLRVGGLGFTRARRR